MNDNESPEPWLAALLDSLTLLTYSSVEQIAYLRRLGVAPSIDELGLEFDDSFTPLRPFFEERKQWSEVLESLVALDQLLSSEQLEWTERALASSVMWESVRRLSLSSITRSQEAIKRSGLVVERPSSQFSRVIVPTEKNS